MDICDYCSDYICKDCDYIICDCEKKWCSIRCARLDGYLNRKSYSFCNYCVNLHNFDIIYN